jgi:hypothetical protein
MMPQLKRFSRSDLDFIKENYSSMPVENIAEKLCRTPKSVRAKIERLGLELNSLDRNRPFQWTDSRIEFLKSHYMNMSDAKIGKSLGTTRSIVCRKRLDLGLRKQKLDPYISNEYAYQYINGKRVRLHDYMMEQKIGRKLTKKERVHHIDGDKTNYDISNLYLCKNSSDHMLVHSSLESVAFELVKSGVIKFNSETGKYYL